MTDATKPSASTSQKPVRRASLQRRHHILIMSFFVVVVLPTLLVGAYLTVRAHDRYVSHVAFSVRSENTSSAMEMLGGIAEISGSSSSDTDILYNFIKSEEMVRTVDEAIGLREMWSKPGTSWWRISNDPYFAYDAPGTIEDITEYWGRMIKVYSDSGTGLIDVEAQAFSPDEAYALTKIIFEESSKMINRLSQISREDRIVYARAELEGAVERLKTARSALTRFRNDNQIVDPQSLIEGQVGLLSSLQSQLAEALIDLDTLQQTTRESDQRLINAALRVEVISNRMAEERKKLGIGGNPNTNSDDANYANIVGEFERLAVDLQFAEQSYTVALTAYDSAQAEAIRQSRYLAAHIQPSQPERPILPNRPLILSFMILISSMIWSLLVLAGYALRDRR